MNTLIVYATKYGCAKKCAEIMSKELNGKVETIDLKKVKDIDLSQYQNIIIGGSIYMGRIQKEVTGFCSNNLEKLKEKHIGLYICGMQEGEAAITEISQNFSPELLNIAVVKESFGGEFVLDKMNFMEKLIVKKVAKVTSNTSNLNEDVLHKFTQKMNSISL